MFVEKKKSQGDIRFDNELRRSIEISVLVRMNRLFEFVKAIYKEQDKQSIFMLSYIANSISEIRVK